MCMYRYMHMYMHMYVYMYMYMYMYMYVHMYMYLCMYVCAYIQTCVWTSPYALSGASATVRARAPGLLWPACSPDAFFCSNFSCTEISRSLNVPSLISFRQYGLCQRAPRRHPICGRQESWTTNTGPPQETILTLSNLPSLQGFCCIW